MKTTKKTNQKKSLPTSKKVEVSKSIESNKISQPTQPIASVDTQKKSITDKVFKYETTFPRVTLTDKKEIAKLLKSESKEVKDRFTDREIKTTDIIKLSKYGHKQLLNGKLKSNSMKFYITLKDDKKLCINFSDYVKTK